MANALLAIEGLTNRGVDDAVSLIERLLKNEGVTFKSVILDDADYDEDPETQE